MGVIICSVITLLVLKYCGLSHNWCLFPIIIVLSIVFLDNLSIDNLLNHFLCMIGMISLESYLYNGYVRYMFMDSSIYTCNSPVFLGHYLDYILIFILGTILAYITNKFSNKILNLLKS